MFGAVAALGACGGVSACASAPASDVDDSDQPSGLSMSVGLVAPALGAYAKIGADVTNGFNLFLLNRGGLIGRHRVDVRKAEEGASAESAVAAVRNLLDRGVSAIVGVVNPAGLAAVVPLVTEARVPLITPAISSMRLEASEYVWRVAHVEGEAGRALAPYALAEGRRAYVLVDDNVSTSRAEAAEFEKAFTAGGGVIVGRSEDRAAYASGLQTAGALGADVVFAACTGANAQAALSAYRALGLPVKLIGPGGLTETADLTKVGRLPENVYTAMYYAPNIDNEANRRFVASYHKQHNVQPSTYAMTAYDCASVMDLALRLVPENPTAAVVNSGLGLLGQIESPRGVWTFNDKRSPQQKWYVRKLRLDGQVPANMLDADLAVEG